MVTRAHWSELAKKAQEGDQAAKTRFIEEVRRDLVAYYRRHYQQRDDQEDAVQEAVVRIWTKISDIKEPQYVVSWVLTIARRVRVDRAGCELKYQKVVTIDVTTESTDAVTPPAPLVAELLPEALPSERNITHELERKSFTTNYIVRKPPVIELDGMSVSDREAIVSSCPKLDELCIYRQMLERTESLCRSWGKSGDVFLGHMYELSAVEIETTLQISALNRRKLMERCRRKLEKALGGLGPHAPP